MFNFIHRHAGEWIIITDLLSFLDESRAIANPRQSKRRVDPRSFKMNVSSEDVAMSPSSASLTSTSSTSSASLISPAKPMMSPSLTSYSYKRPNLGEMVEAPDMKKVHVLEDLSEPSASGSVALQGMEMI